ncbi:MAG: hypothetical protein ACFE9Y_11115 [Promethearchaeota archaeon]
MTSKIIKRKDFSVFSIICMIMLSSLFILLIYTNQNIDSSFNDKNKESEYNNFRNPQMSTAKENLTAIWYKNPGFDDPIEPTWYSKFEGDQSDINATSGSGQANYEILGETRTYSRINGTPTSTYWKNVTNPERPALPDFNEIDNYGCHVSHTWIDPDDPSQMVSVHWDRNITLPVDMSDYFITSVSLSAEVNATVTTVGSGPLYRGGVDVAGDSIDTASPDFAKEYDYVRFYVLISDLEKNDVFEAAYNQTTNLGQDPVPGPSIPSISDTVIFTRPEESLISFLNTVLENDPNHESFTLSLGMRIFCADNGQGDRDTWDSLRFKSCNFSFTYEKKIDEFTTGSWCQDGDKITQVVNDTYVTINDAKLNFKYKINEDWTDLSPNSEIRIYINNNKLPEVINLSKATTSFQLANNLGGFDVYDIINYDIYLNLSIQVYLAENFHLGTKKIISIDDVYLNISYTVEFPEYQTDIEVYFNNNNITANPIFEISAKTDLNITIKYPDEFGIHIPQAVVNLIGNLTATLIEDDLRGQYTIILNTEDLPIGQIYFNMLAHRINYEAQQLGALLIISKIETEKIQLFIDGEEKTTLPSVDVPLQKSLNITVKYKDTIGDHVPGATIQLVGDGVFENLDESLEFEQYSIILNTTLKFRLGLNDLSINAQKDRYEEQSAYPKITVRKINTLITPVSGSNNINIKPGQNADISVIINDADFNETIKGAIVTYTWEFGNGILTDDNNDGIYEEILENVPSGTHSVNITVYKSDIYNFESYEFIIYALRPKQDLLLFQILLIIGIIVSIGIGGYLYAYQKVLKYPKQVRKVRKYRKTLNKKHAPNISINDREKSFNSEYKQEVKNSSKFIRGKPSIKKPEESGKQKKKSEKSDIKLGSKNEVDSNIKMSDVNLNNQKSYHRKTLKRLRKLKFGILKLKKFQKFMSILIITILLFNFLIVSHYLYQNSKNSFYSQKDDFKDNLGISGQKIYSNIQWLNDTSFENNLIPNPFWFESYGNIGDNSDVSAKLEYTDNYANLTVIGENHTFSDISGTPLISNWIRVNNPDYPDLPDDSDITAEGCWVTHYWNERSDQSPSVHWDQNVTVDHDMSDYIITSVNLSVLVNATVQGNNPEGGGIDIDGDPSVFGDTYDYVKFYVLFSDIPKNKVYEVASYQSTDLGNDSAGTWDYLYDTYLDNVPQDRLIEYLTSVLNTDNRNFTITLGIRLWCEDSSTDDIDNWDELLIKSCNFSFTYEKKINRFTTVSWNQDAQKISDISHFENETIVLNEAILNFTYRIDPNWTQSSINSKLRILINNNPHTETIELNTTNGDFQPAKIEGFDVTHLIIDDINVSIQLFLADEFSLDHNITISIDDVELNITYTIISPPQLTDLQLFLNGDPTPSLELYVGQQLNITVKYVNKTGEHIPNATISLSGNFTGILVENKSLEQYTIILDTEIEDVGANFLTIIAYAEDYEIQEIYPAITIKKYPSQGLHVILNNENVTTDPQFELNLDEELNITIKYLDSMGNFIPNASVRLISEGITKDLNESSIFDQYSTIINTSDRLRVGLNYLTIEAQHQIYETNSSIIRLYIRKFNVDISPVSGSNRIEIKAGGDINLRINLNNTDIEELVKGAIVTFVWEEGDGILTDSDNDGIYEGTIEDIPEGAFTITISGFAGDEYDIQNYDLTIIAIGESHPETTLFHILFILSVILIIGLLSYLIAYQTYLKYPRQVRKVRKYRKTLKRERDPSVFIMGREDTFKKLYRKNLIFLHIPKLKSPPSKSSSQEKKKTSDKLEAEKETQKVESEKLIEKSLEKKEELDRIVDKSPDENSKSA